MKLLRLLFVLMVATSYHLLAHDLHSGELALREWHFKTSKAPVNGSLLLIKSNSIVLETSSGKTLEVAMQDLSASDQTFVEHRAITIAHLNQYNQASVSVVNAQPAGLNVGSMLLIFVGLAMVFALLYYRQVLTERLAVSFIGISLLTLVFGFRTAINKAHSTTNPLTMDTAFTPFKDHLNTRWDNTYFYVESNGIPTTHNMMVGITGWQQQVPISQCYIGANVWSIPLNPVVASNPVPVNQNHFLRGAVAVAVNGIPIFNPYTNTGVDALLDGQLDQWGGHCGRADDYHYHIAPLHLYSKQTANQPIAYALDGFAVYGANEPNGQAMTALDGNHGHYGSNGVYHYHGTSTAPYMIGNMVGVVTEDTTKQIIPQAAAKPIRPAGTPLKGAVITNFASKGSMGYVLTYTLNSQTYQVDYNWDNTGKYTFNFISPTGTTTSNYTGSKPCPINNVSVDNAFWNQMVQLYPNPSTDLVKLQIPSGLNVYKLTLISAQGQTVWESLQVTNELSLKGYESGMYTLIITTNKGPITKTLTKL